MHVRRSTSSLLALAGLVAAGACGNSVTDPGRDPAGSPGRARRDPPTLEQAAPPQVTEAARWNEIARNLSQKYRPPQHVGMRGLTYLSLAQYNAVVAALNSRSAPPSTRSPASIALQRGAATGASVALLTWIYPAEAAYLESLVLPPGPALAARFTAGLAIGREIGARVIASAATDNFTLPWTGTVPTGPGFWFSAAPPIGPRLGEMRPFFLTSGSQFRPDPPPAFGSADFLAALAVVRNYAITRTPAQDANAKFWAAPGGFALIPAYENMVAGDLITQHGLSERAAAHAFALVDQAAMDGFIACHDAKYTYWLLRPTMADPTITTSVPVPNHPSYPSNHACVTGALMAALGTLFPEEAAYLNWLADDAAFSRIVGGIHYPFDGDVGLVIGRKVAAWAVEHDVTEGRPYPLK